MLGTGLTLSRVGVKGYFTLKQKIFLGVHNTYSMEIKELPKPRQYFRKRSIQKMYPRAHGILCVSEGVADDLAYNVGFDRSRLDVIYNPIITPDFAEKGTLPVEHPWFRESQPPVILSVGRLTKQKDFPTLIKAFAMVSSSYSCRLMILGEGSDRESLENLIKDLGIEDRVDIPGFTPNVLSYMARAQLFVLSSAWEGLPTVLIEALAVGTSVVSTDCPSGPREILKDGTFGTLVPTGQPQKLAEAILNTLKSRPNSDLIKQRAKDFSVEASAMEYIRVLTA